jgi:phospholipid/cholesterol/gamma-HCH transport system permease protein
VDATTDVMPGRGELRCSRATADTLLVALSGSWRLQDEVPALTGVAQALDTAPRLQRLMFDTTALTAWDSGLVTFLLDTLDLGAQRQIVVDQEGLPSGLRRLLHLAIAVPERQGARREATPEPFLVRVGQETLGLLASVGDLLGFVGDAVFALGAFLRGRARFRRVEFLMLLQECGAQALPIVTLICFLVGPSWPSSGRSNSPCSGRRSMWPIWSAWR